jgi:hypothetical protein
LAGIRPFTSENPRVNVSRPRASGARGPAVDAQRGSTPPADEVTGLRRGRAAKTWDN